MIPHIIHQIWLKSSPSPAPWGLTDGWHNYAHAEGYAYCLHVAEDGWELAPQVAEAKELTRKADIIRLEVLWRYGGIYIDVDIEQVSCLPQDLFGEEWLVFENEQESVLLGNHAMGLRKHSPFARRCMDLIKAGREGIVAAATGPGLITEVARDFPIRRLPARHFAPEYVNGHEAPGNHAIYGRHYWKTTRGLLVRQKAEETAARSPGEELAHDLFRKGLRKVSGNMLR